MESWNSRSCRITGKPEVNDGSRFLENVRTEKNSEVGAKAESRSGLVYEDSRQKGKPIAPGGNFPGRQTYTSTSRRTDAGYFFNSAGQFCTIVRGSVPSFRFPLLMRNFFPSAVTSYGP
jgi:hypothetical protein